MAQGVGQGIEIINVSMRYPGAEQFAVTDVNVNIKSGEFFSFLGPSGCGKTTILRLITGFIDPTEGEVRIGDENMRGIGPNKRPTAMIFQNLALFPLMSVADNIGFGLEVRGVSRPERRKKATELLELVDLPGVEKKKVSDLSGGQMQRVAIAMNFVINPEIYLLDEVSANLDSMNLKLLDDFIMRIKQDKEKTIIMSTHDPLEAIKYADRIAVLKNGQITQIGTPNEIFTAPKDEFTALFVGYENILYGIAELDKTTGLSQIKVNDLIITASSQQEGAVKVCIRPESIGIVKEPPKNTSYRNTFKGAIENIRELGNICHLIVRCKSEEFLITITELSRKNLGLEIGSQVFINFKATDITILSY